jgi:hypothetical protein
VGVAVIGLLGWVGNVLIVVGLYGITEKRRGAFWFSMFGEASYIARSLMTRDWALFSVCWVFLAMAVLGYIRWGKQA